MRLLLDQDVYAITAKFLAELGHEVTTAAQLGLGAPFSEAALNFLRGKQRFQFFVPGGAVGAGEHFVSFFVVFDFVFGIAPIEFAAGAQGEVGEVAGCRNVMAGG